MPRRISKKLQNIIDHQRPDIKQVGHYGKLDQKQLLKLSKRLPSDIFNNKKCCFYKGYERRKHISMCHKGRSVTLHRMFYHNFVKHVGSRCKVVYKCKNKGICCNIKHFQYVDTTKEEPDVTVSIDYSQHRMLNLETGEIYEDSPDHVYERVEL